MPSPEGEKRRPRGRIPPEPPPKPEADASLWHRAASYKTEGQSNTAYQQAQETIFANECDLSAYRLMLEQIWHVTVLGGAPSEVALQQQLEYILYTEGTPTTLPSDVLDVLNERRTQAAKLGSWVEGHHRPGIVFERRKRKR